MKVVSMRKIVAAAAALVVAWLPAAGVKALDPKPAGSDAMTVYVGTYTGPKSKGIYMMKFDAASGQLDAPALAGEATSPSFATISPDNKRLYAIGEINQFQGKKGGAVSAFSID